MTPSAENLIECVHYKYGITARNASQFNLTANECYDTTAVTTAGIYLEATALHFRVDSGFIADKPYLIDEGASSTFNELNASGLYSVESKPKIFRGPLPAQSNGGNGVMGIDSSGHAGYVKAATAPTGGYPHSGVYLASRAGTQVTDGATTGGSKTVTSATAAFVASDRDMPISAAGIPTNTHIIRVINATAVLISNAATADGTGLTLTWGRQGGERLETLFERFHEVAQGTTPAAGGIPAGTSTVTVTGRDRAGTVIIVTSANPAAAGAVMANIAHNIPYRGNQHVQLTPRNAATATLGQC